MKDVWIEAILQSAQSIISLMMKKKVMTEFGLDGLINEDQMWWDST